MLPNGASSLPHCCPDPANCHLHPSWPVVSLWWRSCSNWQWCAEHVGQHVELLNAMSTSKPPFHPLAYYDRYSEWYTRVWGSVSTSVINMRNNHDFFSHLTHTYRHQENLSLFGAANQNFFGCFTCWGEALIYYLAVDTSLCHEFDTFCSNRSYHVVDISSLISVWCVTWWEHYTGYIQPLFTSTNNYKTSMSYYHMHS
jgi:hypothetical protein